LKYLFLFFAFIFPLVLYWVEGGDFVPSPQLAFCIAAGAALVVLVLLSF
jgi:hypothetical protein